jgi:hypothetical protein
MENRLVQQITDLLLRGSLTTASSWDWVADADCAGWEISRVGGARRRNSISLLVLRHERKSDVDYPKNGSWMPQIKTQVFAKKGHAVG